MNWFNNIKLVLSNQKAVQSIPSFDSHIWPVEETNTVTFIDILDVLSTWRISTMP